MKLLVRCLNASWIYVNSTFERLVCDILKAHPQSRCYSMLIGWCSRMYPIRVEQMLFGWPLRKLHFSKKHLYFEWIFDWMPREEASTFQFIWCSIWKPGDQNFWVKICLALEGSKMPRKWPLQPLTPSKTCSNSQRKSHQFAQIRHFEPQKFCSRQTVRSVRISRGSKNFGFHCCGCLQHVEFKVEKIILFVKIVNQYFERKECFLAAPVP